MIHNAILTKVQDGLIKALYTDIPDGDPARIGFVERPIVNLGDLQGEPDPDVARISVTLYENDPDKFITGAVTGMLNSWEDEVYEIEIGGVVTWKRRFTVKARCLLEKSAENLAAARQIASTVRTRLEHALPRIDFTGVEADGEYVARGIMSNEMQGEMLQGGGPPDSYDYFIKYRFDVLTTAAPVVV